MATTPSRPYVTITTPSRTQSDVMARTSSRQSVVMATSPSGLSVAMATTPSLPLISSEQLLHDTAMAQGASFFPARREAIESAIHRHRFQRISAKLQAAKAFCGPQGAPRYVWKGTESAVTNVAVRDGDSPGHDMSEKTLLRLPKVNGRRGQGQPTPAEIQIYKDTSYQCCDVLGDKTCSKCLRYNYRKQHVRGWGKKFRFAQQSVRINHLLPELTVNEIRERLDFQEFSISSFVERDEKRKARLAEKNGLLNLKIPAGRPSSRSTVTSNDIGYGGASSPESHLIDMRADGSVQLVVPNVINGSQSKEEPEVFRSLRRTQEKESKTLDTEEESNEDANAPEDVDPRMKSETNVGTTSQEESGTQSRDPFRKRRPRSSLQTDYVPIKWHYPPHVIPNIDPPLVDSHCLVDVRFYAGKGKK